MAHLFEAKSDVMNLDVRLKLIVLMGVLMLVLTHRGIIFPTVVGSLALGFCLSLKLSLKMFVIRFIEPLCIVSVIAVLKSLSGVDVLYSTVILGHEIVFYADGLAEGGRLTLRIMAAVGAVTVVSLSTPFSEFLGGLSWFRVPGPFVEIALFAYRYLRGLFEDAHVIYNAQRNRLGYSSFKRSFNSFGILAGSLIIKAFDQAQSTAASLHQRGYDGNMPLHKSRPFKVGEIFRAVIFMCLMTAVWRFV